jgi:hypothetical protein
VITPRGRSRSRLAFVVSNDPRIPDEVSYKAEYVNPAPRPANFGSARLWGIAIAGHAGAGPRIGAGRSGVDQAVMFGSTAGRLSSMMTGARCAGAFHAPAVVRHGRARSHAAGL